MGATGMALHQPLNKNWKLEATAILSGLSHNRTSQRVADVPLPMRWTDDYTAESKLAFLTKIFYKKNARNSWELGARATRTKTRLRIFFTDNTGSYNDDGTIAGWLLQPYINHHSYLLPKLKLTAGLQLHHFTFSPQNTLLLPRTALTFSPKPNRHLSLSAGLYAQTLRHPAYLAHHPGGQSPGPVRSRQVALGYHAHSENGAIFRAEIYHHQLSKVPVSIQPGSTFSVLDQTVPFRPSADTLSDSGKGRNFGLDLLWERPLLKNAFARLSASLYRSLYTAADGVERPTRFDGRYLFTATSGREKTKKKKEKSIIRGLSSSFSLFGGFRQTPLNATASRTTGQTVREEKRANELKLKDYIRLDLRTYWRWNKPNRTTTFSIDVQNILNRKNEAYLYYDQVQQRVVTKKQLGMIPLINYRVEF
ncbi:MAG TPA: hypothetical protein ENJ20_02110 [Bacteroidetes bacterium]|nr:hypothetical protein [Bacteroidota bacterium]